MNFLLNNLPTTITRTAAPTAMPMIAGVDSSILRRPLYSGHPVLLPEQLPLPKPGDVVVVVPPPIPSNVVFVTVSLLKPVLLCELTVVVDLFIPPTSGEKDDPGTVVDSTTDGNRVGRAGSNTRVVVEIALRESD